MKLVLLFLVVCAAPASAYDTRFALSGAKVRITASERAFEGILLDQGPDTLRVALPEGERAIPVAEVEQFRVRTERGNYSKEGFLLGFLGGAAWGGVEGASCDCGAPAMSAIMYGGVVGVLIGGVGGIIGMSVPVDRWQEVPR